MWNLTWQECKFCHFKIVYGHAIKFIIVIDHLCSNGDTSGFCSFGAAMPSIHSLVRETLCQFHISTFYGKLNMVSKQISNFRRTAFKDIEHLLFHILFQCLWNSQISCPISPVNVIIKLYIHDNLSAPTFHHRWNRLHMLQHPWWFHPGQIHNWHQLRYQEANLTQVSLLISM